MKNKRRSVRHNPKSKIKVYCRRGELGLGKNLTDSIQDLSQTGARLTLVKELKKGEMVEVELLGIGHLRPVRHLAQVIWSEAQEEGRYLVGIQFDKALSYRDFQELVRANRA